MANIYDIAFILTAYLMGSICTGYYLVRIRKGVDIRDHYSGSVGARNVSRLLGRSGFLLTLFGDFLKGALYMYIAAKFVTAEVTLPLIAISLVLGHVYPVFLNFQGGKGVATSFGVLSVFSPDVLFIMIISAFPVFAIFRSSMRALLASSFGIPLSMMVLDGTSLMFLTITVVHGITLYAHRTNIIQLVQINNKGV